MCIVSPTQLVPRGKEVAIEVRGVKSATETQLQSGSCQDIYGVFGKAIEGKKQESGEFKVIPSGPISFLSLLKKNKVVSMRKYKT